MSQGFTLVQMALMYWQDFGKGRPRDSAGNPVWWRYHGGSKTATPDIRICPAAREPQPAVFWYGQEGEGGIRPGINSGTAAHCWRIPLVVPEPGKDWTGSYAFNGWLYPESTYLSRDRLKSYMTEASVQHPSTTPVFADANWSVVLPHPGSPAPRDLFAGSFQPRITESSVQDQGLQKPSEP